MLLHRHSEQRVGECISINLHFNAVSTGYFGYKFDLESTVVCVANGDLCDIFLWLYENFNLLYEIRLVTFFSIRRKRAVALTKLRNLDLRSL